MNQYISLSNIIKTDGERALKDIEQTVKQYMSLSNACKTQTEHKCNVN